MGVNRGVREETALKRHTTDSSLFFGVTGAFLGIALIIFALAMPGAAGAKAGGNAASAISAGGPKVTVMTRNVYLGADLSPALNATTLDGAIDGGGVIWNEVLSTNFPERAVPLAREIKASGADLVGLQEVALWRQQIPSDLGAPPTGIGAPATQVKFDFLALLMQELAASEATTRSSTSSRSSTRSCRRTPDQSNATGSPPFGAELDGRLTMRDVILRKRDSKVQRPWNRHGCELRDQVHPADRWDNPASGQPRLEFCRCNHQRWSGLPVRQHAPRGLRGPDDPRGSGEGAVRAGRTAQHAPSRSSSSVTSTPAPRPGTTSTGPTSSPSRHCSGSV